VTPPPVLTRSSNAICHCYLCNRGLDTLVPGGVPKSKPVAPPVKMCLDCQGEIAPRVSHVCTRSERNNNILEIFRSVSGRSRGQILSQTLKSSYLAYIVTIQIGPILQFALIQIYKTDQKIFPAESTLYKLCLCLDMKENSGKDQLTLQTKGTPLPVIRVPCRKGHSRSSPRKTVECCRMRGISLTMI
jgi:hypothetical protein